MKIAMVFDVETTGLLNTKYGVLPKLDECPYVVQCSYILYDLDIHKIIKTMNSYVKIPENIPIPAESTAIHGITREMCDSGRLMADILLEFYEDYFKASVLVAHNFKFDTKLLNIEFQRNLRKDWCPCALKLFLPVYMEEIKKEYICTMESSTELCKIGFPSGRENRYKWPTLLELYRHLFLKTPENLHDSMMDCLVCLRCVLKISYNHDMADDVFEAMVFNFN